MPITNFGSDSIKNSVWFPAGDFEGFSLFVMTGQKDSSQFTIGYERGYKFNGTIYPDYPPSLIDTFNTFVAANFVDSSDLPIDNNLLDTNMVGALDSISYSGYVFGIMPYTPYKSEYARIVLHGLTSNSVELYTVYLEAMMTKYSRVDIGISKQPNPE